MKHPILLVPAAYKALLALDEAATHPSLPESTVHLVELRASQINGCSFCVDLHSREAKEAGEADERLWAVASWRESPVFTDAERAALALTEALTRTADQPDPVPDDIFEEAARHYPEPVLATLLFRISAIQAWNRLNIAIHNPAHPVHRR